VWHRLLTSSVGRAFPLRGQAAAAAKTAMDAYLQELALVPELMRKRFALQKATWEVRAGRTETETADGGVQR